jgi:hypothetical protein
LVPSSIVEPPPPIGAAGATVGVIFGAGVGVAFGFTVAVAILAFVEAVGVVPTVAVSAADESFPGVGVSVVLSVLEAEARRVCTNPASIITNTTQRTSPTTFLRFSCLFSVPMHETPVSLFFFYYLALLNIMSMQAILKRL